MSLLIDSSDQPRITDFGLAKRFDSEKDLIRSDRTSQNDLTITGQKATSSETMTMRELTVEMRA